VFRDSPPAPSESALWAAEARLGVALPADYRAFLLAHNGGSPEPAAFVEPASLPAADSDFVGTFFSVCPAGGESVNDLVSLAGHLRSELWLPPHLLAVADTAGDALLLLEVAGPRAGAVLGWWGNVSGWPLGCVAELAPSLPAFLASLVPLAEAEAAAKTRRRAAAGRSPGRPAAG
jgi:hypothetical protein